MDGCFNDYVFSVDDVFTRNEMDITFNPVNELHCDLFHACNDWLYENFDANIGINWDTIDEMIADDEIQAILREINENA